MKNKQQNLEKGDEFIAIIKATKRSYSLRGEQKAGRAAFDGKVFTVVKVRTGMGIQTENHFFGFDFFYIRKEKA